MTFGLPTSLFLTIHVALSLIGILTGLIVMWGMLHGRYLPTWNAAFLVTTLLTSLTGFPLPPFGIDPPRIIGIIELALLSLAGAGLYLFSLSGLWRGTYVVTSVTALYLNAFVAVVQSFLKFAPLRVLAPTQTELPFVAAHGTLLVLFMLGGFLAFRRFDPRNSMDLGAGRTGLR